MEIKKLNKKKRSRLFTISITTFCIISSFMVVTIPNAKAADSVYINYGIRRIYETVYEVDVFAETTVDLKLIVDGNYPTDVDPLIDYIPAYSCSMVTFRVDMGGVDSDKFKIKIINECNNEEIAYIPIRCYTNVQKNEVVTLIKDAETAVSTAQTIFECVACGSCWITTIIEDVASWGVGALNDPYCLIICEPCIISLGISGSLHVIDMATTEYTHICSSQGCIGCDSSHNHAPILSDGYVSPISGNEDKTYNYYVTYKDIDGNSPTEKTVNIDGYSYDMTKISGEYTDGAVYKYSTKLSAGTHSYYFSFSDGSETVYFPTTGIINKPVVSSSNGGNENYHFGRATTSKDVQKNYPYLPIDETDIFSRYDDYVVAWIELNDVYSVLRFRFKMYDPQGNLYGDPFITGWTQDPQDEGWDYWSWYRYYAMYSLKGCTMADLEGEWHINFYVEEKNGDGWNYLDSVHFTIGYQIGNHLTCKDMQDNDPWNYINPSKTFYNTDAHVYSWLELTDVAESLDIKWEYYDSFGELYATGYYTVEDPNDYDYDWWDWYHVGYRIDIFNCQPMYKCGEWKVKIYIKDTFGNWDYLFTDFFEIIDATPPSFPGKPTTSKPYMNSQSVTWSWDNAEDDNGIKSYHLQVGTTPNGNGIFDNNVGLTNFYTIDNLLDEKTYYARVKAENSGGQWSAYSASSDGTTIDITSPTTSYSISGDMNNAGWYTNYPTIELYGTDAISGIDSIFFSLNNGSWQIYTSSITISIEGKHIFSFYATDKAGNIEKIKTLQINIYPNQNPDQPSNPNPSDKSVNVDIDSSLNWICNDGDLNDILTYDVYFGITNPPLQVEWNKSETNYQPVTLDYNTVYYWQIVAWDNHGASTSGPVWTFTTMDKPNNPPNIPNLPTGSINGYEGTYCSVSVAIFDSDGDDIYCRFDWGDGVISDWIGPYPSGYQVMARYAWLNPGKYELKVKAKDVHGAESIWSQPQNVIINSINRPPKAFAGGPYQILEGSKLILDASQSTDPNGDILGYRWDFGNDGIYDTCYTNNPTVSFPWIDDDYSGELKLEVTDGEITDINVTSVNIINAAPEVNAGEDITINKGEEAAFSGGFIDYGLEDTHSIRWDLGDGNIISGILNPTHIYQDNGIYTVILTITDDDGGIGRDTLTVTVKDNNDIDTTIHHQRVWNVSIKNNFGIPGEDISISFEYEIWSRDECASCIQQLVVGINSEPIVCEYSGIPGRWPGITGSADIILQSPLEKGIYNITYCGFRSYNCREAFSLYDDPDREKITIGTIFVNDIDRNQNPNIPSQPLPPDDAIDVSVDSVILSWIGGDNDPNDILSYDVYFSTSNPPDKIVSNQSATSYDLGVLNYETKYYWKIIAWDDKGASTASPIWRFTTENAPEEKPNPVLFAGDIEMSIQSYFYYKRAIATITILDFYGNPVPNATVYGHWSGLRVGYVVGNTNNLGKITFYSRFVWSREGTFTFTVDNVKKNEYIYDETKNVETSDSIQI